MSHYDDKHLSNIWTTIHKKVKQHWGWVEKKIAYKKAKIWLSPGYASVSIEK